MENPAKPYVALLCSPGGVNVLRDSPADYKHHHGLMFAVAAGGVDFWSENAKCGRQLNRSANMAEMPIRGGRQSLIGPQRIDWVGPGGDGVRALLDGGSTFLGEFFYGASEGGASRCWTAIA